MQFVGKKLKEKRSSKKISIDQVSAELNISKNILFKIENDEFDSNINSVFYIGYLRSYAKYLELNGNEIIEQFKLQNSFNEPSNDENIPKPVIYYPLLNYQKYFSIGLASILFIGFYLFFIKNNDSTPKFALIPEIPENLEHVVEKTIVDIELANKDQNNIKKNIENNTNFASSSAIASVEVEKNLIDNNTVTLKFLKPTWLQLRDLNDKIIISQLMTEDDEYSYNLNLQYSLTAGNAGNILVLIDNSVKGKVGDFGEVVDSFIIDSNFSN